MIASWMIYATIVTALCAIVAALLEQVLRANRKPARMIWLAAIVASLLLNVTAIWRSQSAADARLIATRTGASVQTTGPVLNGAAGVNQSTVSRMIPSGIARDAWLDRIRNAVASGVDESWLALRSNTLLQRLDSTMLLLWGVASAITIALLAGSAIRLHRRRTSWRRASVRGVPILVTDGIGPAVVGVLESEIAVPDWIFRLDSSQQQLIVEHERQHLLARDPAVMLAALLAAAVVPWNAAMWLIVRRLRRSTEMDCDKRVLAALPAPRAYAALLVDIGSHSLPHASFGHALADPTSDLERRVSDILNGTKRIAAPVVAFRIAASAALIIAACATPAPRTDVEPKAAPTAPAAPPPVAATAVDARSGPPTPATAGVTPPSAPGAAAATATQQPPTGGARGGRGAGAAIPVPGATAQQRDSIVAATIAAQQASGGGRGGVASVPPSSASVARGAAAGGGRGVAGAPAAAGVRGGVAGGGPPRQVDSALMAAVARAMQNDSAALAAVATAIARGGGRGGRASMAPSTAAGARGAAGGSGTPQVTARGGGGQGAGAVSGVASGAVLVGPGGGRGGVAGVAGGGRAAVASPAGAMAGGRGAAGRGGFAVPAPQAPGGARGGGPGAPPQARGLTMRGTMSTSGNFSTGGSVVASSGTIKREGAVISNRIPSMDSVAVLAAKRFPQMFTESAKTDSLTIVFALDTLGQVLMTASLPVPLQSWVSDLPRVEQIFLDIPQQEVKYGEWRSGTISARGFPTKKMSLLFVVFGRK